MSTGEGAALRMARQAKRMSQQDLADKSGVSRAAIQKIEQGKTGGAQGETLRNLADALGMSLDALLASAQAYSSGSSVADSDTDATSPLVETPRHLLWNKPARRSQLISAISDKLAIDPYDQTHFINYYDVLNETSWLGDPQYIHTTTLEYSLIWMNRNVYIDYEASLVHYNRKNGLYLYRSFIVDSSRLRDPDYLRAVRISLMRHVLLGLAPRVLMRVDARTLGKELRAKCDSIVVLNSSSSLIIGYQENKHPFMLATSNREFSVNAANCLKRYWDTGQSGEAFLKRLDRLTDGEIGAIEEDVAVVLLTADSLVQPGNAQ